MKELPDKNQLDILELRQDFDCFRSVDAKPNLHPFFFATQFHAEYSSRPQRPSPPFCALLRAAAEFGGGY